MEGHRSLTAILEVWRDAERRLERARLAGDSDAEGRLAVEVSGYAREYRVAFEIATARLRASEPFAVPSAQAS